MDIKPNNKTATTSDKNQEKDWWDKISKKEKSEIEEGLVQAERGEILPHEEVMAKYNKWR